MSITTSAHSCAFSGWRTISAYDNVSTGAVTMDLFYRQGTLLHHLCRSRRSPDHVPSPDFASVSSIIRHPSGFHQRRRFGLPCGGLPVVLDDSLFDPRRKVHG